MTYAKTPSMDKSKIGKTSTPYDIENKIESFHWWFVVRRKLLQTILSFIDIPKNSLTLDIGCGTGSNLKVLRSAGLCAIGLDQSRYALTLVRMKEDIPLLIGDLNQLPVKTKSIGLIIAMDIFEHLEEDLVGIRESYRVLDEGGILIVTVPAFKFLWGIQDVVTGHRRRYSRKEIMKRLKAGGFDLVKSSYFNFFLFFPILFARWIIRCFGFKIESENEVNFPLINFLLKAIFSLELYVLKYFSFPFGVSIFCIAKKI